MKTEESLLILARQMLIKLNNSSIKYVSIYWIFSIFSHISYFGHNNGALGSSSIGIVVFEAVENLKFVKSLIKPIFVCINPNLKPIQLRGPSPVQLIPYQVEKSFEKLSYQTEDVPLDDDSSYFPH